MDMIPVTTEETMPSPVDPGEAAAEDEEVGDEADVEALQSQTGDPTLIQLFWVQHVLNHVQIVTQAEICDPGVPDSHFGAKF